MKLRISSLGPVALLASSMMLAFGAQAASADQGIVIYNAQHENLVKSRVDGFTKDTGIKVTLRNGGDSELGNQLVQEGGASPADVFLTENSPAMVLVDNAKLFAPLDAATLARGTAVSPKPRPLDRHRRPLYRVRLQPGQTDRSAAAEVAAGPPSRNGKAAGPPRRQAPISCDRQRVAGAERRKATLEWLKAMKTNFTAYKGNSTVMKAVNAGGR